MRQLSVIRRIRSRILLIIVGVVQLSTMLFPLTPVSVNAIAIDRFKGVYYDPNFNDCSTAGSDSIVPGLDGNTNAERAYNFFVAQGFTPVQSAGIVGNLMQESHVNPRAVQPGGPGRGIAQWSIGQRWDDFLDWNNDQNSKLPTAEQKDQYDLERQLSFIMYEMQKVAPWTKTLPALKATTNISSSDVGGLHIDGSVEAFESNYEKAGKPNYPARIRFANDILARYGGGLAPVEPGDSNDITNDGCDVAALPTDPGDFFGPSAGQKCTVGVDGGDQVGYRNGAKVPIHVCIVNGIDVNVKIAVNVDKMVKAAKADGINLGGGGFRTMAEQTALYAQHGCPNPCKPPTARPGYSNHQMGLAIDFYLSSGVFTWLKQNAKTYGLINFPKEAWHWSVDGR